MPELYLPIHVKAEMDLRAERESAKLTEPTDPLLKSLLGADAQHQPYRFSESLYSIGAYDGIKEPTMATYATMQVFRNVQKRCTPVAAIIRHRQSQICQFARRPRFRGDTGAAVKMRDSTKQPGSAAKEKIKEIEDILFRGGLMGMRPGDGAPGVWSADGAEKAMGLRKALNALADDSLCLDACAFRKEQGRDSKRWPVVFWQPVDAALVRYAIPKGVGADDITRQNIFGYTPELRLDMKSVDFIMRDTGGSGVSREFSHAELTYMVRNIRTATGVMGYGWAEIEQMIDIITGIVYGIKYNSEFFDSNHVPASILALKGKYSTDVLADFRYQLSTMVGGPGRFHTLPIFADPEGGSAQLIPIQQADTSGMFFQTWLLFCATVATALYGMDATEINFVNFGTSSNALSAPSNENTIKYAQESGMEPVLGSFQTMFDEGIVAAIDPDFEFVFTGLTEDDKATEEASATFRLSMAMSTPNMERARNDENPLRDALMKPLWKLCLEKAQEDNPDMVQEGVEEEASKLYEAQGGTFGSWPDAPVGNAAAMQIWMQEHGMGQPQEGEPGEDGEEDDTTQSGSATQQSPDQGQQTPPPGQDEKPKSKPNVKVDFNAFHDRPKGSSDREE